LNIYFDEVLLGNNFLYDDYLHLIYLNEPVVIIIQSFLHSFITWFAIKVKRRVPLVGQELPAFCGFPVAQYSLSCVVFCKSLLILRPAHLDKWDADNHRIENCSPTELHQSKCSIHLVTPHLCGYQRPWPGFPPPNVLFYFGVLLWFEVRGSCTFW
jgi:hypothetical protein